MKSLKRHCEHGKTRALWLAFRDKKISKYIRDWNETSDWFSFLPQRRLFWECSQMIKACLYTIHSERKYSLLAVLAAIKTALSSQQSQGSICGEIRLGTLLAFQCLAVRPDWVRLREAREKTNSCRISVNQVECVLWVIWAVGKISECTFSFSCLPLIPGIACVFVYPRMGSVHLEIILRLIALRGLLPCFCSCHPLHWHHPFLWHLEALTAPRDWSQACSWKVWWTQNGGGGGACFRLPVLPSQTTGWQGSPALSGKWWDGWVTVALASGLCITVSITTFASFLTQGTQQTGPVIGIEAPSGF